MFLFLSLTNSIAYVLVGPEEPNLTAEKEVRVLGLLICLLYLVILIVLADKLPLGV
jgi:hypothetical protein